ncbi:hypothetical protein DUNSADRAFT_6453 [Dunaliella salina]|uniref:Uncharacterized protein n=1 Tax=Dunaliella salina TaxID=3046 RepID=A0ABQ7H6X0_DUNSA|nr:hypothetical protein DUNSADRAFT_6453 [Dunaliella salina]|eukprot:KAF5842603.1 hypothetical protein DUNSADRAFT_6453 [Dunaliella salina]
MFISCRVTAHLSSRYSFEAFIILHHVSFFASSDPQSASVCFLSSGGALTLLHLPHQEEEGPFICVAVMHFDSFLTHNL